MVADFETREARAHFRGGAACQDDTDGCKSHNGVSVRDAAEWLRGTLASRREANRPRPGKVIFGAALPDVIAQRASDGAPIRAFEDERAAAILFVGSTTELSPGAALLASEPDFPCLPCAEGGFFFDAERGTRRSAGR